MKKFFTTDIPTKLLALGVAIFLWVYLVVLLNPQIETTFSNIPITYSEHSNLAKNGYVITSETIENVSLKIRGSRNMLANVNKNNISAYIDLSGCSETGSYSLPIHVRLPYDELSIIDKTPYNVNIVVDKIIERDFDVSVITNGEPKDKVYINNIKSNIETVTVKGPSELIKSIDSAVVYFDASGLDEDTTETEKIILLNNRGEKIESGFITLSETDATLSCSVLVEKIVSVDTDRIAVPLGYEIYSVTPEKVTVKGRKDVLETITSIKTVKYEFVQGDAELFEVPLVLHGDITSNDLAVEVVVKEITPDVEENEVVNDENDNQ